MNETIDLDALQKKAEEYFEHSGVKGMRWGKWNDETKRKYGIGVKKRQLRSKLAEKISSASNTAKETIVKKYNDEKDLRKELKVQRKQLGMSRRDFDKLRKNTLKSHDPEVVARGMHTLSDDELKEKIRRLQDEDKIAKMASTRKKNRNEALSANPLVKLGSNVVEEAIKGPLKSSVNSLLYESVTEKGVRPVLDKKVTKAANQAIERINAKERAVQKEKEAAAKKEQDRRDKEAAEEKKRLDKIREQSENAIESAKKAQEVSDATRKKQEEERAAKIRAQSEAAIAEIRQAELRSERSREAAKRGEEALRNLDILEQKIYSDRRF